MIKFTIIIPVYNTAKHLSACLDSIFNQNYTNIQVIAVDDGSSDDSLFILNQYQSNYRDYMIVLSQENRGVSAARNYGMKYMEGDYILFLDSDDCLCDKVLLKLSKFLEYRSNCDLAICNLRNYHADYIYTSYPYRSHKFLRTIKTNCGKDFLIEMLEKDMYWEMFAWNMVYHREFLQQFTFIKNMYFEDMIFCWEVLLKAKNVHYFSKELVLYTRKRSGQITGDVSQKNILDRIEVGKYWLNRVNELSLTTYERHVFLARIANLYVSAALMVSALDSTQQQIVYKKLEENKILLDYAPNIGMMLLQKSIKKVGFKLTSILVGKKTIWFFRALK